MPSIERFDAGPRLADATAYGDFVFLSGQVPEDLTADAEGQTTQVLAEINRALAAAGSDKTKILKAVIYLADIADFPAMNKAWDAWVVPGQTPARATVEARLANPAYKVEIMVTAVR